jgi:hypothetical protein
VSSDAAHNVPESGTQVLYRVAAFVGGLAILIGAAIVSLGLVLCAPLGVWVVSRVQRSRGKPFGTWRSWISAVGAVVIALVVIAGVVVSRLPAGTLSHIRQAADSASAQAAKQPPPAWLDRLAPGSAARYSAANAGVDSRAFNAFTLVFGGVIAVGFMGNVLGTIGWLGTMLLVFSVTGRWLREAPVAAIESDVS